jgi:long-subunit fatty acid transport protein
LAHSTRAQTADDVLRMSLRQPAMGVRALGIGGAGTAGWADLSALYTNPAGLGFYKTSEVAGGLSVSTANDASTFQVADQTASSMDGEASTVRLGNLSGVYKVPTEQGSLVFGFGYNQTHSFDRTLSYAGRNDTSSITDTFLPTEEEYEMDDQGLFFPDDVPSNIVPFIAFEAGAIEFFEDANEFDQAVFPNTLIEQQGIVRREGQLREVNLAGAAEVSKGVMFGLSANIVTGSYQFTHELTEIDQGQNDNYEALRNGRLYVGLDQLIFRETFTSDHSGFNLRVGISSDLSSSLRFGFSAETPTWTSVSEDFTEAFIRTEFLEGGSLTYGDDPNESEGRGTFDYRITTPWRLSTGLAFDNDRIRVTADVEFVDWSTLRFDSDSFDFPEENKKITEDFGYVFNWRGGLAYQFSAGAEVQAGAAYRPDPRTSDLLFANGETYDRSRLFLSLGASYPLSDELLVDVGWMQERSQDQFSPYTVTAENSPFPNADQIPAPFVDEEVTRNQFQIGIRYQF